MQILNDFDTTVRRALTEIDPKWEQYDGLVVCGTHSPHDVEMMIDRIWQARESGLPFLGICFGHQLTAIEYARNVMGIKDATSEEFGTGTFVVRKLPQINVGLHDGESYWNNYEVDLPGWSNPKNFITVQFHPEYQSSKFNQHPILKNFIILCKNGNAAIHPRSGR